MSRFRGLVLALSNVTLSRGGLVLLRDKSLQLMPGDGLIVTGPNGSGKSSLLATLVGLLPFELGEVEFEWRIFAVC